MLDRISPATKTFFDAPPTHAPPAGPPPAPPPPAGPSDEVEVEGRTRPAGTPATGAASAGGAAGATKTGTSAGPAPNAALAKEHGRHAPSVLEVIGRSLSGLFGTLASPFVAAAKAVFGLFHSSRALDDDKKEVLRKQFGPALDVDKLRIVTNAPFLKDSDTKAVTLGNTIYFRDGAFDDSLLVHEATHALQYQSTGAGYAVRAVFGQWSAEGYNFAAGYANGKTHFEDLNPEQQAELLEKIHENDFESKPRGERRLYADPSDRWYTTTDPAKAARRPGAVDVTPLAEDALVKARQRRGLLRRPGGERRVGLGPSPRPGGPDEEKRSNPRNWARGWPRGKTRRFSHVQPRLCLPRHPRPARRARAPDHHAFGLAGR